METRHTATGNLGVRRFLSGVGTRHTGMGNFGGDGHCRGWEILGGAAVFVGYGNPTYGAGKYRGCGGLCRVWGHGIRGREIFGGAAVLKTGNEFIDRHSSVCNEISQSPSLDIFALVHRN